MVECSIFVFNVLFVDLCVLSLCLVLINCVKVEMPEVVGFLPSVITCLKSPI